MEDELQDNSTNSYKYFKIFLVVAILFIFANFALIFYAKFFVLDKSKSFQYLENDIENTPAFKNLSSIPQRGVKQLNHEEYKKMFLSHYHAWSIITDNMLLIIDSDKKQLKIKWDNRMDIQLTQMRTLINQASQIVPPKEYEAVHDYYSKAILEFSFISKNLYRAALEKDGKLMGECTKKAVRGKSYLNNARQLFAKQDN